MSSSVQMLEIDENSDGQRIDNLLLRILKGVPKSRIYRIVRKGEVRLNGGRVKAETRVKTGDKLRIPPIRTSEPGEPIPIPGGVINSLANSIIYEDDRMLIINKPAGLAVHGGSGVSSGVIEGLRQLRPTDKFLELVHRLDRGTSGCLMIAKKRSQLRRLQDLLRSKSQGDATEFEKHYLAVVHGQWPRRRQHVDVPIRKDTLKSGERVCIVAVDGKPSLTEIEVIRQNKRFSVLAVKPITGRTHQIRVHCRHLHHPVVGDDKYGNEALDVALKQEQGFDRLMLHAAELYIPAMEKGDQPIHVKADPSPEMRKFIDSIK
jgi:23S rRNA pseudouridine955/2504/2580 synthase